MAPVAEDVRADNVLNLLVVEVLVLLLSGFTYRLLANKTYNLMILTSW